MPLKLTLRHGSPYWYVRGAIRGIRIDESTGVSDRAAAQEILIKRSAQVLERSIHGDAASRTFAEAALGYMENGGERDHLAPIIKEIGRKKIGAIGQADIEALAKKLGAGKSASTVNRQIYTPAVAVLNYAARKRWCSKPVIARPKQPPGRVRWISYAEAERLIGAAAPHLQPLVIFLLCTGARVSEALYLDWRFVDLTRGRVIFANVEGGGQGTKNGESRSVPLHPRVVAALANAPWAERTGAVFRKPAGKIHEAGRVWLPYESREGEGGGQLKTAWRGMLKRAALTDFTPHDCRHTWATWHYAENRDLPALMELGGWKSPDMVMRYAHVNTDHLKGGIDRMWGISGEPASPSPLKVRKSRAKSA